MKLRYQILIGILVTVIASSVIAYVFFLSPQQRAAKHLAFVHDAIDQMHPAILESDAVEFNQWHQQGFEQAKALLKLVHTNADEDALLNFYLSGYKDAHLSGYFNRTPFRSWDMAGYRWAGWVLSATQSGYEVVYRQEGNDFPPLKSTVLSCDGQPIDEFLLKNFAPYTDRRWNVLKARDAAAKALTLTVHGILSRPSIKQCEFRVGSESKTFRFQWLNQSYADAQRMTRLGYSTYKLPSLREIAPKTVWVNVSDFQLQTAEAFAAQNQMLAELKKLKGDELVVLDLRGNDGGNSLHGWNALKALFSERDLAYFTQKYGEKMNGADALYRASWYFYWSDLYQLNERIKIQGMDSDFAIYGRARLKRLKDALDKGESNFYQSEISGDMSSLSASSNAEWLSNLNIVLITDRHCVSSCLDFVDSFKVIPKVFYLGEPTDADTVYEEISYMMSHYASEQFSFLVPIKKLNKRLRADNVPFVPDVVYAEDMNNDAELQKWVLLKAKEHFLDAKQ